MTGYCVSDIAAITGGVLSGDGAALVTGVAIDSRAVTPGALFAAIPGERVDGHDYIGKAFDLGAACCLAQRVPAGETRPVICVPDTAAALETLARAYRARFSIPVLGVTGSVGKTTAKEMVASVLSQRWNTLKTEKNFNNQLGVPLTLFRLEPEHAAAVVEMGVSHFGDMAPLAAMVQPTAMLFTIIGHAHLEFLRDRRGVLQEKTSVLDTMPDDAVAFCNGDDDLLSAMECRVRLVLINGRKDEVFYARVAVEAVNEVMEKLVELDARPSDALMIAARFGTGIKIIPAVWESMENIFPQLEQLETDSVDSRAPVYVADL